MRSSQAEIIFADEPTANLDSVTGAEILALLRAIHREQKKTILMVTHSESAASYAERTIWVQDGRIQAKEAIACRENRQDDMIRVNYTLSDKQFDGLLHSVLSAI